MAMLVDMDIFDNNSGILVHQCNAMGVMGAGIAKEIRSRFPVVFRKYKKAYDDAELYLGFAQIVDVDENLSVCNLIGQTYYGRGKNFTDYDAVRQGLREVGKYAKEANKKIYIPYMMSCGLAGGDWGMILQIIDEEVPDAIICRKPGL